MFYDVYCELCKKRGVTPTRAALEIGLSKSTPTAWKNKGITPQASQLQKIADYFDVSADYLLGNPQKEKAANPDAELEEYLEELRTRSEMRMLFSLAKDATKEDVEKAVAIIEALRKTEGR